MVTNPQTNGAASGATACNPESAVTSPTVHLSAVLREVEKIQLAHGQCFAAFSHHARPDCRESASHSRAVFAALETLGEKLRALPHGPQETFPPDRSLFPDFPGSAEEQPGPREESRPPIGNPPVTAAGANPRLPLPPGKVQAYAETNGLPPRPCPALEPWLDSAKTSEVEATLDVILLELHCRGRDFRPSETVHPYLFNRPKR